MRRLGLLPLLLSLQVWLPAAPGRGSWTRNAIYEIVDGENVLASATLDQTRASDEWRTIAQLRLTAGSSPVLRVRNGDAGSLVADAIHVYSSARHNSIVRRCPLGHISCGVHAIGDTALSEASPQTSATVTTSARAPGPPMAVQPALDGGRMTATWRAPHFGVAPTLYEVHIGTSLGFSDVAPVTTPTPAYRAALRPGSYWVRTRAAGSGGVGAWSNAVHISIGDRACSSDPRPPILLPVTNTSGQLTFTWWPSIGEPASAYTLHVTSRDGLTPALSIATVGTSSGISWPRGPGDFVAHVVAHNRCGASVRSNEFAFSVPRLKHQ